MDTDVIFQSSVNGLRTNKDLTLDLSNFSSKSLIFTCGISEGGGKPGRMEKNGPGDVVFASTFGQTMTNGWSINEGTVYVGNGGAAGQLSGGAVHLAAGTTLSFNRSDAALVQATDIEGPGQVTMIGTGVATLSGNNTYSGGTTVTSGLIGASAISNLGTGDINLNGGGVQFAAAFDLTANNLVVGSSGATFNTNGNDVTFANAFQTGSTGQVTVTGAGSLSIGADQDYSGGTSVNGTLLANAATSSTGSGAVTVNSGGILGGDGAISGDVTIDAGGIIAPGNSVGELTVGTLNLAASSAGVLEFNVSPANDHIVVSSGGGLTIDGGAFELVQEGTVSPFATPGTYNLISYSGSIGGAGVSALSVSNQQPGYSYTFAATGTEVTLTIATSGVVSEWITDGSGLWTDGANWSAAIPDGAGETALFTTSLTAPSSVDLNGPKTVGAMAFDSANGYTLTQGGAGALNLNSGTVDPVQVAIVDGVHEVAADVALTSTLATEALDAADGLNISGGVSGAGGVTKTGDGTLGLLGSNTFTGDVDLGGGTTTFASGGLGAGSNLGLDNATLVWDSGNTDDVSSKTVTFGTDPVSFDTNGNNVTLANPIGDSGASAFTKAGTGTLELSADATFTGDVTIADGVLQLGSGAAAGSVIGNIANSGVLVINRSDNVSFTNVISGTGGLNQSGTGDLALPVANTFSGDTNILSGSITLQDATALQNSTLNYGSGGGSIGFDTLTAVTLGGLSGDKDLALENTTPAGVALTVGGNGSTTSYSGVLSGTGASLQKNGAGILTLAGVNTYDGATFVNEGTLEVTGSINGTTIACGDGDIINVNGGTITSSTFCDIEGDLNITAGGTANYDGGVRGDNSDASVINVIDGTLNATFLERRRDANFGDSVTGPTAGPGAAPNVGLVVGSSGTANIDSANIGTSNTGGCVVVDGGILNVTGTFAMGIHSSLPARWSVFDARSGELNITDTTNGIVLSPGATIANKAAFYASGAICRVGKITFGDAAGLDGIGLVDVTGDLYMGAGGAVQAAPVFTSIFRLSGGNLAASTNWTSSVPVTLADAYNSYITGADEFGDPYDIELAGGLTGGGGVIKDGDGEVTVSGPITYTGDTQVWFGTLTLTSAGLADASNILVEDGSGAILNLAFAGGDRVAEFADDSGTYTTGTVGAVGSGADHETAAVTGTGLLYLNEDPPVTAGYDSWATGAGLTGANNGPTQDAEFDGIDNVLEFVLGGDPLASDTDILPTLDASGANYVFSFTRDDESEAEVTLTFQYGSDLAGWTDVVIGADNGSSGSEVDIVEDGANPDQITITVPKSGTEMFGRLRAVK
ncbi:MAG: autotransporter-associated beta strand repeat-containing protein [Akkermansiaceae bacterium]|nr:autotransporter-associated beta strand repeat-containing protein [Akkermansiaceae bacterium]